jgi:hypothetical protein
MQKLAPNQTFITPAGAILVPDWLEPYFCPSRAETLALYQHMEKIELPSTAWNEWRQDLECERVSEIRSYYHLFTIWIRVALWQKSCRVNVEPVDEWGRMIFRELKANRINFKLTPTPLSIVFPSLTSTAAP